MDQNFVADFIPAENDSIDVAAKVGEVFKITLPDRSCRFPRSGYMPERSPISWGCLVGIPAEMADEKILRSSTWNSSNQTSASSVSAAQNAKFDRTKPRELRCRYMPQCLTRTSSHD